MSLSQLDWKEMTTRGALNRSYMVIRTQRVIERVRRLSPSGSKYYNFTCQLDEAIAHDDIVTSLFPMERQTNDLWKASPTFKN